MGVVIAGTPSSLLTANPGGTGRRIDRCQDGTVLAFLRYTGQSGDKAAIYYSKNEGASWTPATVLNVAPDTYFTASCFTNPSMFVDLDDCIHLVWKQNTTTNPMGGAALQNTSVYYMRGVPNAGRTGWTWGTPINLFNSSLFQDYPDVVACRDPAGGGGWQVFVVSSFMSGSVDYATYIRIPIASNGTPGTPSRDGLPQHLSVDNGRLGGSYATARHTWPSIDFNHTGDGKTVAGGTPHLYVAWSSAFTGANRGIRYRKATYAAGAWTWGTEQDIDTTRYIDVAPNRWLTCHYDGTRVTIVGYLLATGEDLVIYDRDVNGTDTTTTTVLGTALATTDILRGGSATYDAAGNIFIFGADKSSTNGNEKVNYRKWTRATSTLSPIITLDSTGLDNPAISAKRGYSGGKIETVHVDGLSNPYQAIYNSFAPPTPATGLSPSGGALVGTTGAKRFSWIFGDPDGGDTQSSADIRYRLIGAPTWTTITGAVTTAQYYDFAANTFAAGNYEWQVLTYDAAGTPATGWSASALFTASPPVHPAGLVTKVGSFAKITSTGQQVITGLGFTPKAIIFFTSGSQQNTGAFGTWYQTIFGLTTGPGNSYCAGMTSKDAVTPSSTARGLAAKAIYSPNPTGGATYWEADLFSLDPDGFTINWTVNNTDTSHICFLAIGGTDITNALVMNWATPLVPGPQPVVGAGFTPDLVFHGATYENGALPASTVNAYFGIGAMNEQGQQFANAFASGNGNNPTDTSRIQQTDSCLVNVLGSEQVVYEAHFQSMDANGFTTFFSKVDGTARKVISLLLKGVSSKIGAFAKTRAAGPAVQSVARVGFAPKAILASSISNSVMTPAFAHNFWSLGATDGTNQRVTTHMDFDISAPSLVRSAFRDDAFLIPRTAGTPAVLAQGALTSMDADGFTVTFNPTTTDLAEEVAYVAIGSPPVNLLTPAQASFEDGSLGGWFGAGGTPPALLVTDLAGAVGLKALRATFPVGSNYGNAGLTLNVPVHAGVQYTFSAFCMVSADHSSPFALAAYGAALPLGGARGASTTGPDLVERLSVTFTPTVTDVVTLQLDTPVTIAGAARIVWIDGFQLEKGPVATAFVNPAVSSPVKVA